MTKLHTRVSCLFLLFSTWKEKTFWLFNFFFCSSCCWGILSDSSRTGILDALHSRLFFISDGSHSVKSPTLVSKCYFNNYLTSSHPGLCTFWLILKFIHKVSKQICECFLVLKKCILMCLWDIFLNEKVTVVFKEKKLIVLTLIKTDSYSPLFIHFYSSFSFTLRLSFVRYLSGGCSWCHLIPDFSP